MKYKVANALTERHKDENGYLYVDKSPILRAGILEYYGSELLPEGADDVDGVKVDPDKIYKVYIPEEEIRKSAETFKMIPITDDHTWLGDDGEDAKDYQVGMTGENVYVEDGFLYVPLKFTGKDIVDEVESHEKEELSSSYYNRFEKSKNSEYDFIARDIKGNHLALVDKGRCGSAVRVLNSKIGVNQMAVKAKIANEAILKLDGKEINLDQFFEEEADEREEGGEEIHDDSISENEDKREIIREIMAVAGKADADFEGGEDEKVRTIAELAEKLAYKPSEESESDNACSKNEDEKEEEKKDEGEKEEDKEEDKGAKSMNYDALYAKISNALKAEQAKVEADKVKAYNSVHGIIGDFNPFGMSDKDMYVKALNHLGVELDGSENVAELSAMLKACSAVRSKVDNGFSYESAGSEEVEFNI